VGGVRLVVHSIDTQIVSGSNDENDHSYHWKQSDGRSRGIDRAIQILTLGKKARDKMEGESKN
jgi:hypothetical protein